VLSLLPLQYFRISSYLHQQHQSLQPTNATQSLPSYIQYPVSGPAGLCVATTAPAAPIIADVLVRDDAGRVATGL
jgi:hypothetical protein